MSEKCFLNIFWVKGISVICIYIYNRDFLCYFSFEKCFGIRRDGFEERK